jgi:hypothetical protein
LKNFKNKRDALEFMIKNPGVKGVTFSITKEIAVRKIKLCLKTLHDLKEQAKGVSALYGYIELFNNSVLYFRAEGFPESYRHFKFDFTVEKIPASALKFRPDMAPGAIK